MLGIMNENNTIQIKMLTYSKRLNNHPENPFLQSAYSIPDRTIVIDEGTK
jgi:hypothetical protein